MKNRRLWPSCYSDFWLMHGWRASVVEYQNGMAGAIGLRPTDKISHVRYQNCTYCHSCYLLITQPFSPPFVAPKALEAVSVSTSVIAVTVVPNQPSRAHYFTVNFKGGAAGTLCRLNAGAEPLTCTFGSLTIGQEYTFEGKACVTRG